MQSAAPHTDRHTHRRSVGPSFPAINEANLSTDSAEATKFWALAPGRHFRSDATGRHKATSPLSRNNNNFSSVTHVGQDRDKFGSQLRA